MLLSIDVGIKNLAICILGADKSIKEWKVINLLGDPARCQHQSCRKIAKHHTPEGPRCGLHSRGFEDAPSLLMKLVHRKRVGKKEVAMALKEHAVDTTDSLITALSSRYRIPAPQARVEDVSFLDICCAIIAHLDPLLNTHTIHTILIENQPARIAPVMKNIQSALTMFFATRNYKRVIYVSACNKLRSKKQAAPSAYASRKKDAIELVRAQLAGCAYLKVFEDYGKKDDLADCYLQAVVYLDDNQTALSDA